MLEIVENFEIKKISNFLSREYYKLRSSALSNWCQVKISYYYLNNNIKIPPVWGSGAVFLTSPRLPIITIFFL